MIKLRNTEHTEDNKGCTAYVEPVAPHPTKYPEESTQYEEISTNIL